MWQQLVSSPSGKAKDYHAHPSRARNCTVTSLLFVDCTLSFIGVVNLLHRYYTPTKQNTPPILTYIYAKFTQPQVAFYKFLVTYAFFAYFLLGFPFAITNHLGDALFRGVAVSGISDTDRTNPTTWVHFSSLPHKIYEKFQSPRREAFLRHPSVYD